MTTTEPQLPPDPTTQHQNAGIPSASTTPNPQAPTTEFQPSEFSLQNSPASPPEYHLPIQTSKRIYNELTSPNPDPESLLYDLQITPDQLLEILHCRDFQQYCYIMNFMHKERSRKNRYEAKQTTLNSLCKFLAEGKGRSQDIVKAAITNYTILGMLPANSIRPYTPRKPRTSTDPNTPEPTSPRRNAGINPLTQNADPQSYQSPKNYTPYPDLPYPYGKLNAPFQPTPPARPDSTPRTIHLRPNITNANPNYPSTNFTTSTPNSLTNFTTTDAPTVTPAESTPPFPPTQFQNSESSIQNPPPLPSDLEALFNTKCQTLNHPAEKSPPEPNTPPQNANLAPAQPTATHQSQTPATTAPKFYPDPQHPSPLNAQYFQNLTPDAELPEFADPDQFKNLTDPEIQDDLQAIINLNNLMDKLKKRRAQRASTENLPTPPTNNTS